MQRAFDRSIIEQVKNDLPKLLRINANIELSNECCLENIAYSDIQIKLEQVDLARISNALFNPDKEFKHLPRETAVTKLNSELSYWHPLGLSDSFQASLTISAINDEKYKEENNKKINELIKIVDSHDVSDTDLRFDIVIRKANENDINKLFT